MTAPHTPARTAENLRIRNDWKKAPSGDTRAIAKAIAKAHNVSIFQALGNLSTVVVREKARRINTIVRKKRSLLV